MKLLQENKDQLSKLSTEFVNDYDLGGAVRKFFNQNVDINRDFPNNHDLGVFVRNFLKNS